MKKITYKFSSSRHNFPLQLYYIINKNICQYVKTKIAKIFFAEKFNMLISNNEFEK